MKKGNVLIYSPNNQLYQQMYGIADNKQQLIDSLNQRYFGFHYEIRRRY